MGRCDGYSLACRFSLSAAPLFAPGSMLSTRSPLCTQGCSCRQRLHITATAGRGGPANARTPCTGTWRVEIIRRPTFCCRAMAADRLGPFNVERCVVCTRQSGHRMAPCAAVCGCWHVVASLLAARSSSFVCKAMQHAAPALALVGWWWCVLPRGWPPPRFIICHLRRAARCSIAGARSFRHPLLLEPDGSPRPEAAAVQRARSARVTRSRDERREGERKNFIRYQY
jgi:hypothetical protein